MSSISQKDIEFHKRPTKDGFGGNGFGERYTTKSNASIPYCLMRYFSPSCAVVRGPYHDIMRKEEVSVCSTGKPPPRLTAAHSRAWNIHLPGKKFERPPPWPTRIEFESEKVHFVLLSSQFQGVRAPRFRGQPS